MRFGAVRYLFAMQPLPAAYAVSRACEACRLAAFAIDCSPAIVQPLPLLQPAELARPVAEWAASAIDS